MTLSPNNREPIPNHIEYKADQQEQVEAGLSSAWQLQRQIDTSTGRQILATDRLPGELKTPSTYLEIKGRDLGSAEFSRDPPGSLPVARDW